MFYQEVHAFSYHCRPNELTFKLSSDSESTKVFPTGGTPLVPATVPMLTQLQGALRNVRNDTNVPAAIRVDAMGQIH